MGNMAWCKVIDDDNTYVGHKSCSEAEFNEYLAKWKEAMGLGEDLYAYDMVAKGIEKYPVFLK